MADTYLSPLNGGVDPDASGLFEGRGRPSQRRAGSRLGPLIHGVTLAATFCVFAWSIALGSGVAAGALGAVAGAIAAEKLIESRYRLPVIVVFALGVALGGAITSSAFSSVPLLATMLGPTSALAVSDAVRWGALILSITLILRAAAIRYRATLAIEGGAVVLAVSTTVAAHRDGMIARPLEVADWFWSQGVDPVVAFLAIGLLGALLFAAILAYGRTSTRALVQLLLVALVGIFLAAQIHSRDPSSRKEMTAQDADKRDDERAKAQKQQQQQAGQGGQSAHAKNESEGQRQSAFQQDDMPRGGGGGQNRPAGIVIFHKDVAPSLGVFYFRHAVFSQFNGSRLIQATVPGVDTDVATDFVSKKTDVPGVHRLGEGREMVATDVALITDHTKMFTLIDAVEVEPLANPDPARFRRAYRVLSSVLTVPYETMIGSDAGDAEWTDDAWKHYTELPRDERYHRLAAELQGKLRADFASDPIARALVVKNYLEKNATYSFKKNYEGEEDPTAAFLFSEEKLGYCVHTAHAAAYLLRAMGVPSRVSAGYAVPAANLGGGSALLIKAGDAHAWAEVYLSGMGWVPIEVTPEKSDVEPTPFNEKDLQSLFGEMARKEGRQEQQAIQEPQILKMLAKILRMVPFVLLGLIGVAYATKAWRLAAPAFAGPKVQPKVAYRAALDRLAAVGLSRAKGESRERFASRLGETAPSIVPLTSAHVSAALGWPARKAPAANEPAKLSGLAGAVGKEVRKKVPIWRWAIGVLNPVSWFWSR